MFCSMRKVTTPVMSGLALNENNKPTITQNSIDMVDIDLIDMIYMDIIDFLKEATRMNSVSLNVSGIANAHMKTSLKNALDKIPGIQSVDVDKTLGRVTVGYNDPADTRQIQGCIEETGFKII